MAQTRDPAKTRGRGRRSRGVTWHSLSQGHRLFPSALAFLLLASSASCRILRELSDGGESSDHEWNGLGIAAQDAMPEGSLAAAAAAAVEAESSSPSHLEGELAMSPVFRTLHRIFPSNISGTYKGTWEVAENQTSLPLPDLRRRSGNIIFQIKAVETARREIHFLHGEVVLRDGMYISDGDVHMKLEGVYVRTWGQIRMILSNLDPEVDWEDGSGMPYHLALDNPGASHGHTPDQGGLVEMSKSCRVRMVAHVSPTQWDWKTTFSDGVRERVPSEIQGVLESPWDEATEAQRALDRRRLLDQIEAELRREQEHDRAGAEEPSRGETAPTTQAASATDDSPGNAGLLPLGGRGASREYLDRRLALIRSLKASQEEEMALEHAPCFATLRINATAVDLDAFYNKAVNYTLMVTFVSFLQVLFIIRQMEHSNTQTGSAKVSMLMIGQQAIMDAYLCLLHLTAGIVVESLFNAFATAAFFKFVIFSIFEMRYLLAIWKARRPSSSADSWDIMRRELSVLYSRFYGFLLGGILLLYKFNSVLRYLLLVFYSFWVPQIVTSVVRESRKPLHLHYILGISLTRLAMPLYIFGCPKNFMRIEPNYHWCCALVTFMGAQVVILLLQHFFGPRCFIPRQFLPEKYSYFRRIDCSRFRTCSSPSSSSSPREEGALADCVICMAPVLPSQLATDHMVTPCDHLFHTRCLQRWMDIKMECPTCRRSLPPL